jgi:hypothetical protein
MSDADIKEARRILRLIQEHLLDAHLRLGAKQEPAGLVDVIYCEDNGLRDLNYVTPRKSTAWVPGPQVEMGLNRLSELGRAKRVSFIEGLYLPVFAKSLRELGLKAEREITLMTYTPPKGAKPSAIDLPEGVAIKPFSDADHGQAWRDIWRDPAFDMMASGIEPMYVGEESQESRQQDFVLTKDDAVIGAARITFHEQTAHIVALALKRENHTPETARILHQAALNATLERACELIFISGEKEADRAVCRNIGFVDTDSIICYAEASTDAQPDGKTSNPHEDTLAQPVLALR